MHMKVNGNLITIMGFLSFIGLTLFLVASKSALPDASDPLPQVIRSIKLQDQYTFGGEPVPVKETDVAERLERELILNTYQHSSTLLHLKLSYRFFPEIEKIFAEEGIPDDLKFLAVAESSLRNAVSSAGAKGIWQFKEAAAKELGLEVNDYVDERNDLEKSTVAACQYLKLMKEKFGSWTLAAAAYNMGPGALSDALEQQKEKSYYDLNLSDETNRYIFRILAIKDIMENPEKFGFYVQSKDGYNVLNNYYKVESNTPITNLADFAHQYNISYRLLKVYNPWLLKQSLPNKSGKKYIFKIPNKN